MVGTRFCWSPYPLMLTTACLAIILCFSLLSPAWSMNIDDTKQPESSPERPTLPEAVAAEVSALVERIEELREAAGDDDLAQAIELAEEVLAIRMKHQGAEAMWTTAEGDPAEWYEVGDARRRVQGLRLRASLNPEQLAELAAADKAVSRVDELAAKGQFAEALELTTTQLEIRRRLLGNDHHETLTSINNMSFLLLVLGPFTEAEPYCLEAMEGYRRVLGDHHPETLIAINNMGSLIIKQGRYDEAEPYFREVCETKRRILGDDHMSTLHSINNMGSLLYDQGRYAEAETDIRESLAGYRQVLGNDHPATLRSINNMGLLHQAQGRYAEAESYLLQALAGHRRVLGDEHPSTLLLIHNIAVLLGLTGRYAEAEPYGLEALEGSRRVLGDDHLDTFRTINTMGSLLQNQGQNAEAEPYYREALERCRLVLGDDHPYTLVSINNIGNVLEDQSRYPEADPFYREALEGRRRVLGDDHPHTLMSINNVGSLLDRQGRYADGEPYYREALETRCRVLGGNHPDTTANLSGLARLLYDKGEYAEAEAMWAEAANSFEVTRLLVSPGGLSRVEFAAIRSPLAPLAACLARNGKPVPAWQRLEANLARGLLDTVSVRYSRPLESGERDREEDLIGQLSKIDERIGKLMEQKEEAGQVDALAEQLRKERERLQAELAQFEAELTTRYGVTAGEVYPLERLQQQLRADAALLAWVDMEGDPHATNPDGEHWACVVRHQGDPRWVRLPGSGTDETWTSGDDQLAHQLRKDLNHWPAGPSAQWRQSLIRQLHAQRIAPVQPLLDGVRNLVVLPAGKMAGIPVEALTDDYTVSYVPSGTMYAWLKEQAATARSAIEGPGILLALGDPLFPQQGAPQGAPPEPPDHGVLVTMVAAGSNALRTGIQEGDVVLSYGGSELGGPEELGPAIQQAQEEESESAKEFGDEPGIPIRVWRDGEIIELSVAPGSLGVRPAQQPAPEAILARRRLDAVMAGTRGTTYKPIPHTRREVEAIAGLFMPGEGVAGAATPMESALVLLGSEASEQRLIALAEAGELEKYGYIHLATHGVMDDKLAMNSAMILSRVDLPDAFEQAVAGEEIYDGRLTAEQIVRTWKLNSDLVTLSGCETALGRESEGEGFLGFSQALFVAGARSLLLSLWKVDDQATMLLMKRFYENLLGRYDEARGIPGQKLAPGSSMPKAIALREAKLWLRSLTMDQILEMGLPSLSESRGAEHQHGPDARSGAHHPYENPQYWASFILLGDPG